MRVEVRGQHRVGRIHLAPEEQVQVCVNHLAGFSESVAPLPRKAGSFRSRLGLDDRLQPLILRAYDRPGWVDVAGTWSGEVATLEVSPHATYLIPCDMWLAHDEGVTLKAGSDDSNLADYSLDRVSGHGTLLLASYGDAEVVTLQPSEVITLKTGHVLALDEALITERNELTMSQQMFKLTGPGQVVTQARNITEWRRLVL